MKNTKYKLFLLVSKYMPVVIAIGIFINIILAIVYKPLLIVNIMFGSRALFVLYNVDSSEIKRVNRMSLAAPLQG